MPPRGRGDDGAATTELVMATPALLFLIMLLVQTGLWFHAQHVAQAAAQEAVRAVRVENGTEDAGRARAHDFLDDLGREIIQNRKVEVGRTPDVATVTVSGFAVNVVPGLRFSISEEAEAPVERFRPAG
ncbi:MAG TPA: TadE/TadG family type IV pilus assembly protein [Acidimicrobiales bacterium]